MGRENFHRILDETQQNVLRMGSLVEEAITKAVDALSRNDVKLADEILRADDYIDDLNVLIETNCLNLLALQQPMASDLRTIAAMLDIIIDLERIGDHACDIAQITKNLANEPQLNHPSTSRGWRRRRAKCCANPSMRLLIATPGWPTPAAKDDEVDRLYRKVFKELIQFMAKDAEGHQPGSNLSWSRFISSASPTTRPTSANASCTWWRESRGSSSDRLWSSTKSRARRRNHAVESRFNRPTSGRLGAV